MKLFENALMYGVKGLYDLCRKNKSELINKSTSMALYLEAMHNINTPVFTKGIALTEAIPVKVNGVACTATIILNPYVLKIHNVQCAMAFSDTISQIIIFVDDSFMWLKEDTKEFVFWHEIGHLVCNHVVGKDNGRQRLVSAMEGGIDHKEIDADLYARKKIGDYDKAVKSLIELADTYKGIAGKELRRRAIHIERLKRAKLKEVI